MIFDQSGALANVKRQDYLPFGEELIGLGLRSTTLGYSSGDGVRQKFTSKEQDTETGLDYFVARYYSSVQGRFVSGDEPLADQSEGDPQSWNMYSYAGNHPLLYTDPFGRWKAIDCTTGGKPGKCYQYEPGDTYEKLAEITGINVKDLKGFFGGVEFGEGDVVDVSGVAAWRYEQLREFLRNNTPVFAPAGGGTARAGAGILRNLFRRLFRRGSSGGANAAANAARGTLTGSLKGLTQAEKSMVEELLAAGKNVQIIPRATGKTADFIINGVITELKTPTGLGANTLKNAIEAAAAKGSQVQILIDARGLPTTARNAFHQITRAQGNVGGLTGRVTVLTKEGVVSY
jgi:RHS repeat-associated protein